MKKERIYSLDLLRILCCIFVIGIHIFMSYRVTDSGISYDILFIESFFRCCVPVFFMITGFFMFQREKLIIEVGRYLVKRIILPTVILLIFVYIFSEWLYGRAGIFDCLRKINLSSFLQFFLMLLNWRMPEPNFWLWYITTLVQIYFFYPLLKYICVDRKEENVVRRLYIFLCGFATMFLPTVSRMGFEDIAIYVYTPLPFYAFVYVLIGYELLLLYQKKSRLIDKKLGGALYVSGSILTYLFTVYLDISPDNNFEHLFFNYEMLNVAIAAIGLITLFLAIESKGNGISFKVSGCTFLIYLIHYPIILKLQTWGLWGQLVQVFGTLTGCGLFIGIVFTIALVISMLFYYLTNSYCNVKKKGAISCKK